MTCTSCGFPLDALKGARPQDFLSDGSMILCGSCGNVNIAVLGLGDPPFTLRLITKTEFDTMHKDDQNDLYFAVRAIIAQRKKANQQIIKPIWYQDDRPGVR